MIEPRETASEDFQEILINAGASAVAATVMLCDRSAETDAQIDEAVVRYGTPRPPCTDDAEAWRKWLAAVYRHLAVRLDPLSQENTP